MSEELIERTFTAPAVARLKLSNIRGVIDIQPGDSEKIQVIAVKHLEDGDPEQTEILIDQNEDGIVRVETRYAEGAWWWFFSYKRPCKVDYTVRVPRDCSLKINSVSSSAWVQGIHGELSLSTVTGQVNLRDLHGDLKVSSVSGEVYGENLSGELRLETVSGDVFLSASNLSSLNASTVSGDLNLGTPVAVGPYRFHTVSGQVRLRVPPETRCVVESTSISGRVYSDLPITASRSNSGHRSYQVQGGGTEIQHHSISGSLYLIPSGEPSSASEAEPLEETGYPETNSSLSRREVLERIANGELTAEEALKALG